MTAIRNPTPPPPRKWDDYVYDIETYPNIFMLGAKHAATNTYYYFELSDRRNDVQAMEAWLDYLRINKCRMVGFNNEGFDYPVIHHMMQGHMDCRDAYYMCEKIINTPWNDRFANVIWENDRFIPQLDLFKIHHFDNQAKSTSLKALEFAMRMHDIRDLPYDPGEVLVDYQIETLASYMEHDVDATLDFYRRSSALIELRDKLTEKYSIDHTNFNDTKIGKKFFEMKLEEAGIPCYDWSSGRKTKRQTPRPYGVPIKDVLFPWIRFRDHGLQQVLERFKTITTTTDKGGKLKIPENEDEISTHCGGITLDFGLGGLHGSVEGRGYKSNNQYQIIDVDVTSYYPSIPIEHRIYPEHLGEEFCDIYAEVKAERLKHAKGTPENAVMKLALNGVYGDSNNKYSSFFDPKYTLTVTVNGQLMLAMLCEWLTYRITGLQLIQANTDGVTCWVPRNLIDDFNDVCKQWERVTKLDLEYANYKKMFVRDVNNYFALDDSGKIKSKGAYTGVKDPGSTNPLSWHADHSAVVVPMIAVKYLLNGGDIMTMLKEHDDIFDFMIRAKVRRQDKLLWGDEPQQKITRYYASTEGHEMWKVAPMTENQRMQKETTTAKLTERITNSKPTDVKYKWFTNAVNQILENQECLKRNCNSRAAICKGRKTWVCNNMADATAPIDFEYYHDEIVKLVEPFIRR